MNKVRDEFVERKTEKRKMRQTSKQRANENTSIWPFSKEEWKRRDQSQVKGV